MAEEQVKKAEGEKRTLEESFARLDELLQKFESGNLPLEEAFHLYKEGMTLLKESREQIDTVEKKVQQINEDGELSDF